MQASGQIEDSPSSSVKWLDSQHKGGLTPGVQKVCVAASFWGTSKILDMKVSIHHPWKGDGSP
jgi:hypothetical protein